VTVLATVYYLFGPKVRRAAGFKVGPCSKGWIGLMAPPSTPDAPLPRRWLTSLAHGAMLCRVTGNTQAHFRLVHCSLFGKSGSNN
jgi:hypothetical protein